MIIENHIYTQKEVNKIFSHIPTMTMRFWYQKGVMGWHNTKQDKRGMSREYGFINLIQIAFVIELMNSVTVKRRNCKCMEDTKKIVIETIKEPSPKFYIIKKSKYTVVTIDIDAHCCPAR